MADNCLHCHEEPKGGHDFLCGPCQKELCPMVKLQRLPLEKKIVKRFSPSSENKENDAKHINRKRKIYFNTKAISI